MNILIVYTYPNHKSLNDGFLQSTLKGLKTNTAVTSVKVLDLYAEQFDPVLHFDENHLRRNLHKVPELEAYREQLRVADKIVFIYPIWWGRPPAMLLGYIDRLFTKGFAYEYRQNSPFPDGYFKDKEAICITTMKGPTLYPFFLLNNANKVLMKKGVCNFVGIKKVKFFEFGGMEKKEGKQNKKLLKIERFFASIT